MIVIITGLLSGIGASFVEQKRNQESRVLLIPHSGSSYKLSTAKSCSSLNRNALHCLYQHIWKFSMGSGIFLQSTYKSAKHLRWQETSVDNNSSLLQKASAKCFKVSASIRWFESSFTALTRIMSFVESKNFISNLRSLAFIIFDFRFEGGWLDGLAPFFTFFYCCYCFASSTRLLCFFCCRRVLSPSQSIPHWNFLIIFSLYWSLAFLCLDSQRASLSHPRTRCHFLRAQSKLGRARTHGRSLTKLTSVHRHLNPMMFSH